jgi:hypothetical protein
MPQRYYACSPAPFRLLSRLAFSASSRAAPSALAIYPPCWPENRGGKGNFFSTGVSYLVGLHFSFMTAQMTQRWADAGLEVAARSPFPLLA